MRLIDADALIEKMMGTNRYFHVKFDIDEAETIDPEELPIVKELRCQADNLCEFLCYATNGKLSKSNYTVEEMKVALDDCVKLECDNCSMASEIRELREKLARYEQAEKDGRLIELPCKIGEKVFAIYTGNTGKHPTVFRVSFEYGMIPYFGKAVFLTKEEAETELKERED